MSVHLVDPIRDPRWLDFLQRQSKASVFHSPGWLGALEQTYGCPPVVFTTTPPGADLTNGLVACRVRTLWRSEGLVSLPYSDHCDPLVDHPDDLQEILAFVRHAVDAGRWAFLELRPRTVSPAQALASVDTARYAIHVLDLTPPFDELVRRQHPSCVRRAARRAVRDGVTCVDGCSDPLMASFYNLLRMTRRRHGLPPQPISWFRHLRAHMGDQLTIRVASKDGRPVAAMLTLAHKRTMVFKYGGSDVRHHCLGAVPLLFDRMIREAKQAGYEELDLGRSDLDQAGLVTFKGRLGAAPTTLTYYRHPVRPARSVSGSRAARAARRVLAHLPSPALNVAGRLLYRRLG